MIRKKCFDKTYEFDENTGHCIVTDEAKDEVLEFDNPIIAWNVFWGKVSAIPRDKLTEELRANEFNIWTGEKGVTNMKDSKYYVR